MNWRRVVDVLLHRAVEEVDDERSIQAKRLDRLETETHAVRRQVNDIIAQSRFDAYRRIRIPR